jgi:hypothetical protein
MKFLWTKIVTFCLAWTLMLPLAQAKTILFVPADDRPVSLSYAADTVKATGWSIVTPPVSFLGGRNHSGNPELLWQWVKANAGSADALVLSNDSLLYGSLVDSRKHSFSRLELRWRLQNYQELRQAKPDTPIYVFSTLMRSPQGNSAVVEPLYYDTYGLQIFQLTALRDKEEIQPLTPDERAAMARLEAAIPTEFLADWLDRRDKNFVMNTGLVEFAHSGLFNYLIIGRDDTAPFSQSHREGRWLTQYSKGLTNEQYAAFPGADQLGILLLARAYNELTGQKPLVSIRYTLGKGGTTVASYEDQPIDPTLRDHILAAGGIPAGPSAKPDLILAVNTPVNGKTSEAETFENFAMDSEYHRRFAADISNWLKQRTPVAIADIAFANGSDNALMKALYEQNLLDKLAAYSGWNTASNTIGYTVAQGMMARDMKDEQRKQLLAVRYLDDWAYQANIRKNLYQTIIKPDNVNPEFIAYKEPALLPELNERLRQFTGQYLWLNPSAVRAFFPWHRMFEITVEFHAPGAAVPAAHNHRL